VTTELCAEAARRHGTSPLVTCALGRGLTATALLATLTKGSERVTVQISSSGPMHGLFCDVEDGGVRGGAYDARALAERPAVGRVSVVDVVGREGVVNVVRDLRLRERYQGQTHLVTGEVDEDVEAYLRVSEQVPSALGCEVILDAAGSVVAAAGVLIQTLPGAASQEVIREAQHRFRTGELFAAVGAHPDDPVALAAAATAPHALDLLSDEPLAFRCPCDLGRIQVMLAGLDPAELDEMIAEGKAEIRCNTCGKLYQLSVDELRAARQRRGEA
jgi:molecular chaperone Hsp33